MAEARAINHHILGNEKPWVVLCGFLKSQGYELRARYQPDWVPSWTKLKHPHPLLWKYEDGENSIHGLMDAIRVSDGARVMLKLVKAEEDQSAEIGRFFASEPRGTDPLNHCLPLLDVLHPPDVPDRAILVTPYCLAWKLWPFVRVDEAVDFFMQIFEGLAFMHKNNVAHLDASQGNIVMDAVHLYQEPFHPMRPHTQPHGARPARHLERYQSEKPVKYYFIDFEGALRFDGPRPLVKRRLRQDKTVPEECVPDAGPCDPFAVDIYCVGNVLVEHWLKAYKNVEFIRELAEDMTSVDPAHRPTAEDVVRRFQGIRDAMSISELGQPLVQVPLYHSGLLQGQQMLAEERRRKKAAAAAKRAARKKERAEKASVVWGRLGGLLSTLLPRPQPTLVQDALPLTPTAAH
ncbi:hypothetical protein AURDEDRAFT_186661 [Auricularia subglabra TFB-10046 SS5]|nr:hypothetical protein AURDEDRAFT_186661 [Auricularia subglabra TFB-10046 SS5]